MILPEPITTIDLEILDQLPTKMRDAKRWLVWKSIPDSDSTKKPRKVPYYVTGTARHGTMDTPADIAQFGTFDNAVKALRGGRYAGLGFALGADGTGNCWQGVDLDHLSQHPELEHIRDHLSCNTYTEKSPNGDGEHAIGYGGKFDALVSNATGIEAYSSGRFFTVTGDGQSLGDELIDLADYVTETLKPIHSPKVTQALTGDAFDTSTGEFVTPQQVTELRSALSHMRADDRGLWVEIGHALKTLGEAGRGLWMDWSATSESHDPLADSKTWDSFKPEKTNWRAVFTKAQAGGWINPLSNAAQVRSDGCSAQEQGAWLGQHGGGARGAQKPVYDMSAFVLNGQSAVMAASMLTDAFILGMMAILGQWTVFYAKPNAGKTLLIIWLLIQAIRSGEIKRAPDVFYINADDTHKGLVFKLKLAEQHGFNMLAPGYNGFKADMLAGVLSNWIQKGEASGKIIILDTLKKFTDIMHKSQSSAFGEAIRQFILHGGSVIALAHVNKHRGEDGKVVFSGTSDVVDDADCSYMLDTVSEDPIGRIRTVKFDNFKSRGDVTMTASYQYNYMDGATYQQRLDSVRPLDAEESRKTQERQRIDKKLFRNGEAIQAITSCIRDGITLKTDLINKATERSTVSKAKIKAALNDHTGESFPDGHLWSVEVIDNNAHNYRLTISL